MLCSLSTLTYRRAVNFNRNRFNVSIFDQERERLKFQGRINPDSTYVCSREYGSLGGILLGVLAKKTELQCERDRPEYERQTQPSDGERHVQRNCRNFYRIFRRFGDVAYRRVVTSFFV